MYHIAVGMCVYKLFFFTFRACIYRSVANSLSFRLLFVFMCHLYMCLCYCDFFTMIFFGIVKVGDANLFVEGQNILGGKNSERVEFLGSGKFLEKDFRQFLRRK